MAGTKIIGILTKYIPFIGILVLHIFSLYRGATTVTDEINRNIQIWTDTLIISAIIGSICSLLVLDLLNILITGKTLNIVQDVLEKTSQDAAVMYNGMVVSSLFPLTFFSIIVKALLPILPGQMPAHRPQPVQSSSLISIT